MDNEGTSTCVICWAESLQDKDGDEVRHWYVSFGDDWLDPVDTISNFYHNECGAKSFAHDLAVSHKLPVEYID